MRDPKRIDRIISVLGAIWKTYPDLRLTQLIENANVNYNTEDEDLVDRLIDVYFPEDKE
jgi:hypothetical protein